MMRKPIFFLIALFILLVAIVLVSPPREDGEIWAILVAGSPGFHNYAMQADICRAYQILIKGKVKKDHIIVFMADDVANDPRNFIPGSIIFKKLGPDVYGGVSKDYTGKNLNLHNFLAVLAGNKKMIKGGSGKVLATQANDRIFLFYSGHGYEGFVQFGDKVLRSEVLLKALQQNYNNKKYKSMVMYFASCRSGSMFVQHNEAYKSINVYAMASSNEQQNSRQVYAIEDLRLVLNSHQRHELEGIGLHLATQFGALWMKDSERHDRRNRTIQQQYAKLRADMDNSVWISEVMQFGNIEISKHMLSMYQGFG